MAAQDSEGGLGPPSARSQPLLSLLSGFLELCPTIEGVQALLESGVDQATKIERLQRVILRAASSGDVDVLSWVLQQRSGDPALHNLDLHSLREQEGLAMGPASLAASAGHVDALKLLVDHGADVNETDAAGWTPLMWAVNSSNLALVSFLLRRGANVEARSRLGSTCEDFIVAFATSSESEARPVGKAQPHSHQQVAPGSTSQDRELMADMIYDHIQIAAQRRTPASLRDSLSVQTSVPASPALQLGSQAPPQYRLVSQDRPLSRLSSGASTPNIPSSSRSVTSGTQRKQGYSTSSTSKRLVGRNERSRLQEADLRLREVTEGRKRALLDVAVFLDIEYAHLAGQSPDSDNSPAFASSWAPMKRRQARHRNHNDHAQDCCGGLAAGCGAIEVGADPLSVDFDFDRVLHHQMIAFGEADIEPLLNHVILAQKPVRAPWVARAQPANIVYLCLRFAVLSDDEDLVANLVYATLEKIEDLIKTREFDMISQAFWLFNVTLLLHYVKRDALVARFPKMSDEYQLYMHDLINEIYVSIIRDLERRISRVLEAAMLEHESIPGFEDVRFEGDWNFMKSLTGSVKASSASLRESQGASAPSSGRRPLSQMFAQWKDGKDESSMSPASSKDARRHTSKTELPVRVQESSTSPPRLKSGSVYEATAGSADISATDQLRAPDPRTVTSLLTSALHVLQLYEINPAIIVQALSQVFFWVGCELFNRVLSNRRYLCRSKAMQLKLNVSALEDWARSNALPLGIVRTHLAPVTQLISWLSCQSSLRDFDALIGTLQGLRALTPLQMKRAVRDYKYEVGESKMSAECMQYLDQLIVDWNRRQEQAQEMEEEQKARVELDRLRQELIKADEEAASPRIKQDRGGTLKARHLQSNVGLRRSGTITQASNLASEDPQSPGPAEESSVSTDVDSSDQDSRGQDDVRASSEDLPAENDPDSLDADDPNLASDESPDVDAHGTAKEETQLDIRARAAQALIDSLFLPGRSMADYVPAGTPGSPAGKMQGRELLPSSTMLPFALPSETATLIVSPGDAFGFGRGHFAGTGTPALRDLREFSGSLSATPSSTRPSTARSTDDEGRSEADSSCALSVNAPSSSAASTASGTGSVFTSGRGFAAGGYWQPVPIVKEESLDALFTLMRDIADANLALIVKRRRTAAAALGFSNVTTPLASAVGEQPPWGWRKASGTSLQALQEGTERAGGSSPGHNVSSDEGVPRADAPPSAHEPSGSLRRQASPNMVLPAAVAARLTPRSSSLNLSQQAGLGDDAVKANDSSGADPTPSPSKPTVASYAPLSPRKHLAALLPLPIQQARKPSGFSSKADGLNLPKSPPTWPRPLPNFEGQL
ncbi:unnamed protein product [Parajaminaea phylloscopi]